jgi:hypothetical protein
MGLFDIFQNTGDPDRDAAFNRGLIAAGLQLMQAKGRNIFPALGQAGAAGMQAADQTRAQQEAARDQALRRKMVGYQLSDAERQKQMAELPGRFYRAPSEPAIDATGGMETATEAPNNASGPGGFDLAGYYKALQGMSPLMAEQFKRAVTPEPTKPVTLGRDQRLVTPAGQEIVPAMPADAEEKDAFVRMMKTAGIDPASPQGRAFLQDYLKKMATHAPAATMNNYGSPVAGVNAATGDPVFVVTDKTGGVKQLPGIRPPRSAAEEKTDQARNERERQGQQMQSVMAQARKLLETGKPTGSGVGSAIDAAGRVVGYSPPGAKTAAQLESLSGWLVANVPRMEGPQSNFDVQNYMTMAGKVGMRDVPVGERLAALEVVESLQRKYSSINASQPGSRGVGDNKPAEATSGLPPGWTVRVK